MELENRMSLGYQKGQFWVPDSRFDVYRARASYKKLLEANTKAGFGTNVEYSYTARRYTAEIVTYERFHGSDQLYIVKHNNAYDENPMAALTRAIRESGRATPLVSALCLEIEVELLQDAYQAAIQREKERARLDAKLAATLDRLDAALSLVLHRGGIVPDYECENCIGMIEHGCYCMAMGCPAPGLPPVEPLSAEPSDVAAAQYENAQRGHLPALYDEDDDL